MDSTTLIAIVGRPNVGKSTLFNRLVGRRDAIVDNQPGVTRDRIYGMSDWRGRDFGVIDTGGFDPSENEGIWKEMKQQVVLAIEEADAIIFLLDATSGVTATDEEIAGYLRRHAKVPVFYTVNKIDGEKREDLAHQFWSLAPEKIYSISAEHGRRVDDLLDDLYPYLKETPEEDESDVDEVPVAVVGRPNVGKSTLINTLLGNERLLTHDAPGTTRDAVDSIVTRGDKIYKFIDTAGIRKKGKVSERIEKFSVIKALKAIDRCHVTVLIIDAVEGPRDQDAKVAAYALNKGKAAVILLNKWDLMEKDTYTFDNMVKDVKEKLPHVDYASVLSISAKSGQRVTKVLDAIDRADEQHARRVSTPELNKVVEKAIARNRPSVAAGKRIKFYYATQYAARPPRFVIFTNRPRDIRDSYERYLVNRIREAFGFEGTPVKLVFRPRKGHDRQK